MADFSITRVPDRNLFGLLFPPLEDISEYFFEIITPEYIDDYHVSSSGVASAFAGSSYAVEDVSKYDYILLPLITAYAGTYDISGMNNSGLGSAISGRAINLKAGSGNNLSSSYALEKVDSNYNVAIVNTAKGYYPPIIGFKRHRSDGVNPKSPLNEPDVKEELIEEPVIKDEPIEEPVEKMVKRSTKK